jgi:hypothetical protein
MTKKKVLPNQITVIIPYKGKPFDQFKYGDPYDCYLAEQLKKKGYREIAVGGRGNTHIEGVEYRPKEEFSGSLVKIMLAQGDSIKVTLKRV